MWHTLPFSLRAFECFSLPFHIVKRKCLEGKCCNLSFFFVWIPGEIKVVVQFSLKQTLHYMAEQNVLDNYEDSFSVGIKKLRDAI